MAPIWGRYGPFFLYGFSVVLGVGVLAALGVTALLARRRGPLPNPLPVGEGTPIPLPVGGARGGSAADEGVSGPLPNPLPQGEGTRGWLDGALLAGGGALLGGRAVFVWLNVAYFAENPAEAGQLWLGGLNYHGALLGGLAALWLWARLSGRPFGRYAGLLAPGLALLVAFGWAACAVEGCAYGRAAAPGPGPALWRGLGAGDLPDDAGVYALRYRTQLAGAIGALLVFGGALWAAGRLRPATLFWGTLGGLALVHGVVALGRGDPSPVVWGMRLVLWAETGLLVMSMIGVSVSLRGQK